jgi:rare lipoprotein A
VGNRRIVGLVMASAVALVGSVAYAAPLGTGVASWYGAQFKGHRMANGCGFDPARLTAASRVLPIGSWVRITNKRNHRSLVVQITDRGPYVGGRIVDVSQAVAQRLDMLAAGLVMVTIERLDVAPRTYACRAQSSSSGSAKTVMPHHLA